MSLGMIGEDPVRSTPTQVFTSSRRFCFRDCQLEGVRQGSSLVLSKII